MFYSGFYGNVFIPLSCLTASAIVGLYAAILVLLKKQSKKLEFKATVAPSGDTALDGKKHANRTSIFMLSKSMTAEQSNRNLSPPKTEQLDSNLCISNQTSSANLSSDLNRPDDSLPTKVRASLRRRASASDEFPQTIEEDKAYQSTYHRTAEICEPTDSKTKLIGDVRQRKSVRHGSLGNRCTITVADHDDSRNKSSLVRPYPLTFQSFVAASGSLPKPRLSFRHSISVSRPRVVANSAGLNHDVVSVCDMNGAVSVLRKSSNICGDICAISNVLRERGKRRVEGKTAKLSAIAVASFLICWLPFPVIVSYQRNIGNHNGYQTGLFLFGLSLSFLGAAVNQLVYCLVNRQLRQEFTNLCAEIASKLRKGS